MITLNQHKENITKRIIRTFSDDAPVQLGFSKFFPSETTIEKQVGIEVERNMQKIAVDVQRCTDPVKNTFATSVEKLFEPPFYNEAWDFVSCQRYDVTFGARTNPSTSDAINMLREADRRLSSLRNKVLRAIELQRTQVLQTGIVTLRNGDNIDYKRKATSIVALGAGDRWNEGAGVPLDNIATGCEFLRTEGLSAGNTVNAIMGQAAYLAFINNDQVKEAADFRRISRLDLGMPQFDGVSGMTFQGQFAAGDFVINVWTYNAFYTNDSNVQTKFLDTDKVVLLPEDFEGVTAYAGIPAIMRDKGNAEYPEYISAVEAEMYINNYIDPVKKAHWFELASAPLAIPVSIDRIYTIKVLA